MIVVDFRRDERHVGGAGAIGAYGGDGAEAEVAARLSYIASRLALPSVGAIGG